MTRFTVLFVALFSCGYLALNQFPGLSIEFTFQLAKVTYWINALFDSSIVLKPSSTLERTLALGHHNGFFITVTTDCSALKTSLLLAASQLAYPLDWKRKVAALVICAVVLQLLNCIRLISLVYIGESFEKSTFDFIHESVWTLLLNISAVCLFLASIYFVKQDEPKAVPA